MQRCFFYFYVFLCVFVYILSILILVIGIVFITYCVWIFMVALRSRCGRYIFALWFLLSFVFLFSSPNLSGRRVDVYHTSTHGVALVRI